MPRRVEGLFVFFSFIVCENKGLKVLALKPGDISVSPTKTLFAVAAAIDAFFLVVLGGLASCLVACVISLSFLKQERIVLHLLWDSLKNMSAQIAERLVPGPLAGSKQKGQKKAARAANNKALKGKVNAAMSSNRLAGRATGVAGVDNRLSMAMAHIQDGARMDLMYLLELVDLKSVDQNDYVGTPDITTEFPTGIICLRNTGVCTTTAGGAFTAQFYPTPRSCMNVQSGTSTWGQAPIVGGEGRAVQQYGNMLSSYTGVRCVALQVTLRAVANLTVMSGMIAVAPLPPQDNIPLISVAILQGVPLCTNGTVAEIFADGEKSFSWLPGGASRTAVGDANTTEYSPLLFNRVTRIADGIVMPSINIAIEGGGASVAVLEVETRHLYEFTTTNVVVPTNSVTPSSGDSIAFAGLAGHPKMLDHVRKNQGKNSTQAIAKHVIDNWDTYKRLGANAYKTLLHASGMGASLLGSAAKYAAPAAALLL